MSLQTKPALGAIGISPAQLLLLNQPWFPISCSKMMLLLVLAAQECGSDCFQVLECSLTNAWLTTPWEQQSVKMRRTLMLQVIFVSVYCSFCLSNVTDISMWSFEKYVKKSGCPVPIFSYFKTKTSYFPYFLLVKPKFVTKLKMEYK